MAQFIISTLIHAAACFVFIVTLVAIAGTTKKDIVKMAKALGFGFLVYHSDSKKYFYCMTRKDALEWMAATYADACMFSYRTKEVLSVVVRKQQSNFA